MRIKCKNCKSYTIIEKKDRGNIVCKSCKRFLILISKTGVILEATTHAVKPITLKSKV